MARASSIAVVATACRLPDANSPEELWANIVEGRRSFRAVPRERLDLSRYAADVLGEAEFNHPHSRRSFDQLAGRSSRPAYPEEDIRGS